MASGMLNYPPEIVQAAKTMQSAAKQLDQEMADLNRLVHGLVDASKSGAVQAFSEVQQLWSKSGLSHNETLNGVANAADNSYQEISSFDNHLANKFK